MTDPNPAAEIDAQATPRRGDQVHTVVLDGEAVLLDEHENRLHLLNHTATLLWQLYDGATSLEVLADEISDELDLDAAVVLSDLVAITHHLATEGLLEGTAREVEQPGA